MLFGVCLKCVNSIKFRDNLTFFYEFVPQFIFMTSIFGYMIVMIFIKWSTDWSDTPAPPSIITTMINLAIKLGSLNGETPLYGKADGST